MIVDIAGTRIDWASISEWCARVKEEGAKGSRLEPALLTDEALERLIQKHPDLALVDRLRAERELRANSS